jgi:hypothetical protein
MKMDSSERDISSFLQICLSLSPPDAKADDHPYQEHYEQSDAEHFHFLVSFRCGRRRSRLDACS